MRLQSPQVFPSNFRLGDGDNPVASILLPDLSRLRRTPMIEGNRHRLNTLLYTFVYHTPVPPLSSIFLPFRFSCVVKFFTTSLKWYRKR